MLRQLCANEITPCRNWDTNDGDGLDAEARTRG